MGVICIKLVVNKMHHNLQEKLSRGGCRPTLLHLRISYSKHSGCAKRHKYLWLKV